ncbi:MAG: TIR domain-containing protein [Proteobacteria bacterium]|nr:TIR domain-containing protein [Pseudomonadota bacterium]
MGASAVEENGRYRPMSIRIEQNSSYTGNQRWDWEVWLAGPIDELDQIEHVTYTLHPTFSEPVREISSRENGFRLKSDGWGEFTLYIDIARKDGGHEELSHELKLAPQPKDPPAILGFEVDMDHLLVMGDDLLRDAAPVIKRAGKAMIDVAVAKIAEHLPTTTVFVSGGVADADAVSRLKTSLGHLKVNILSDDEVPAGVPYQAHIANLIGQADVATFLVSGRPSRWMTQEIEVAQRHGKRIVPVLVGKDSVLPEALRGMASVRIENLDSVAELTKNILGK